MDKPKYFIMELELIGADSLSQEGLELWNTCDVTLYFCG